jgi:hypothetical protein
VKSGAFSPAIIAKDYRGARYATHDPDNSAIAEQFLSRLHPTQQKDYVTSVVRDVHRHILQEGFSPVPSLRLSSG